MKDDALTIEKILKSEVQIHERSQVELMFSYGLRAKEADQEIIQPKSYVVDAFFLFPPQLRVSKESYPIEKFYHDLRSFIRFREPKLSYKEMIGKGKKGHRSPLLQIEEYVQGMRQGVIATPPQVMIEEARIFGCSYFSYFSRRLERTKSHLERLTSGGANPTEEEWANFANYADETVEKSYLVLKKWRTIVALTEGFPDGFLETLKEEIEKVNEYCSYIFRTGVVRCLLWLDPLLKTRDDPKLKEIRKKLALLVRFERWYSRKSGFYWIDEDSKPEESEAFLYRFGLLKRRVWSSLYLNSRTQPLFKFQRHIGGMLAAAFAGAWAIMCTLLIGVSILDLKRTENLVGFGGFMIVTAFTLAYVLKDRIKELGKGYFKGGVFGKVPDASNKIFFRSAQEKIQVGSVQEKAAYSGYQKLAPDILALAKKFDEELGDDLSGSKGIIHYRKTFNLDPKCLDALTRKIRAVHNVIRISFSSFLGAIDSRYQDLFVISKGGKVKAGTGLKVYHIDFIIKKRAVLPGKTEVYPETKYYRIILSKNGIERIDTLM